MEDNLRAGGENKIISAPIEKFCCKLVNFNELIDGAKNTSSNVLMRIPFLALTSRRISRLFSCTTTQEVSFFNLFDQGDAA